MSMKAMRHIFHSYLLRKHVVLSLQGHVKEGFTSNSRSYQTCRLLRSNWDKLSCCSLAAVRFGCCHPRPLFQSGIYWPSTHSAWLTAALGINKSGMTANRFVLFLPSARLVCSLGSESVLSNIVTFHFPCTEGSMSRDRLMTAGTQSCELFHTQINRQRLPNENPFITRSWREDCTQ